MDEEYSEYESHSIIPVIIVVMIGVILIATVLIPIVHDLSHNHYDNGNPTEVTLGYMELDQPHTNRTVTVAVSGDKLVYSGDYSKTVPLADQVIVLTDSTCVYVRNGALHYFNGTTDYTESSMVLTIIGNTVNSIAADWVYFPMNHGQYSSYISVEYNLSDNVGFDVVNKDVVTNGKMIDQDGKKVMYNVKTRA